jgi:hypothetical protein
VSGTYIHVSQGLVSAVRERETMSISYREKVVILPEEKFGSEGRRSHVTSCRLRHGQIRRRKKTDHSACCTACQKAVAHGLDEGWDVWRRGGGHRNLRRGRGGGVGSLRGTSGDLVQARKGGISLFSKCLCIPAFPLSLWVREMGVGRKEG